MEKTILSILLCLILFLSIPQIHATQNDETTIYLDYNNTNGLIQYYSEINCGPLPNHDHSNSVDLTTQYQQVGLDFVRTHDFSGPTDISTIFPDFSADPTIPSNYNFTSSDMYIKGIIDAGCQVFYRLGESASINETLRQPPQNYQKWATICKHIIMHYNDGWADGYHYNISYFEIWNEPDLKGFWNGTAEQYYMLYHITAETLKTYDPTLRIGGPCTSSIHNENFTKGFLSYIKNHDLPLDFFSWHMYANHPNELSNASNFVRHLLDSYGFYSTENINTEWNINIIYPQRDKDNAKNAAFTACSQTVFQDARLDYGFRYRGTGDDNWLVRSIGFDLSLFSPGGMYKTPALIYKILNAMEKQTPLRLYTPSMNASTGFTYLAGKSEDSSTLSLMVSNYDVEGKDYSIRVENLPSHSPYTITQYIVDDSNPFIIAQTTTITESSFHYSEEINPHTVHFFWISNQTEKPGEGPDAYPIPILLKLPLFDIPRALLGIIIMFIFFG